MKRTLVFGASLRPDRYSNLAIRRLVQNHIETLAFGSREGEVAGVPVSKSLEGIHDIHTLSLYMNPNTQKPFYQEILRLAPERVIFNPGAENPELMRLLEDAGIKSEAACTLVLLATGAY